MSFGDLFSSSRGPGLVGLVLALLVLGGFGAIVFFVFDAEQHLDGTSLKSVIKQQTEEIEDYRHQIETNTEALRLGEVIKKNTRKVEELLQDAEKDAAKLEALNQTLSTLGESVVATSKEMNGYVSEYRNNIRLQATGEKIPELTTASGRTYKELEVRTVTDVGIEVRHSDGIGRIPFEELPAEWQERFQFDPEAKAKALAREREAQAIYEKAAAAVQNAEAPEKVAVIDAKTPEQAKRILRPKVLELARLKNELGRLQAAGVEVETNDDLSRSGGNGKTAQILDIRKRSQAIESRIMAVTREIADLKRKIHSN